MTQEQPLRGFPYEVIAFDVSPTTQGDTQIKAGVAAKHLVVVGLVIVTHGSVEAKFQSGTGTGATDITGALTNANNNYVQDRDTEYGLFWTAKDADLTLDISGNVRTSGYVLVVQADDMPQTLVK